MMNKEQVELRDTEYDEYDENGRIWGVISKDRIRKIKFPRISKEIIDEYLKIDDLTSSISDVLDSLGINGVVAASHIPPVIKGKKIAGTAITLRSVAIKKTVTKGFDDNDFIRMASRDANYLAESGDVLVADNGGNLDVSNMGGQSIVSQATKKMAGAVVNGAVRDIPTILEADYPVWSKGITPITGKNRIEAIEMNGPVMLHNIVINPGDLIVADDSGVCAVPADKVEYVLEEIQKVHDEEDKMRKMIKNEDPISELKPLFRKRYE